MIVMWRYLWIAAVVFVSDQLTKFAAADYLTRHGDVLLTSFLNFSLVHNTGAAFGFLSSASGWQNIFFIVVASVACIVILWMTWRLAANDLVLGAGLMLVLGGAAGNLTDRLFHGYVIDFVDVYYRAWHWPAFNVADSAITVGAVLLAVDALGLGRKNKH
ncbi:MAG: signal peptidase II [Sulfuricaulis sp.]|nr:signal peptidase II [Sulfuricaulis sp.]